MTIENLTSDEHEKLEALSGNRNIPLSDLIDEFVVEGDESLPYTRKPRRKVKK
jgi:hypothetical protein